MAQLIQMKQQIRAIETIKKITHAMRLISMSSHSKMGNKINFFKNYKNELSNIMRIVQSMQSHVTEKTSQKKKILIILIGSQKGLAGTFNSALFRFFEKQLNLYDKNSEFITIGKKATDFLKKKHPLLKHYDNFNLQNLYKIAKEIFQIIIKSEFSDVIIYSNYPKSFFAQIPEKNIILPIKFDESTNPLITENYIWEQPITDISETIKKEYINFALQSSLFNSLYAEQSARFNSMDSATRNAEELLENLKRQYNKLRQAKITKEITEISSTI